MFYGEVWYYGNIVIGLAFCEASLLEAISFLLSDDLMGSLWIVVCCVFDKLLLIMSVCRYNAYYSILLR